jgi:hypothetical protein
VKYDNAEHMMEVFGGSFVKALVDLWYRADSTNKQRLRAAFPEYFKKYELMFKAHKESQK